MAIDGGRSWKFEDILTHVGEFGPYQIRIFALLTVMDMSIAQCMLFYVYGNIVPPWSCTKWNGTATDWGYTNLSTSPLPTSDWREVCVKDGLSCEAITFHGPIRTIVSEWHLVCGQQYIDELSISLFFLGVLFGAGFGGQIADLFGRRRSLLVSAAGMMVCQVLVGFASPWQTYLVLRMLVGACCGANMLLCFTIPIEFIGVRWRALCGTIGLFGLGLTVLTGWAYYFPDWRHQAFLAGGSGLPLLIAVYAWVPESVRWLVQKGRFVEAETIIARIAEVNKRKMPDLTCLKHIALLDEQEKLEQRRYTYVDLFRTKQMTQKTLVLALVWVSCSLLYYGITSQLRDLSGSIYINSIVGSLTSMPISWCVIFTANRFGRKKNYVAFNLLPCVAMVLVLVLAAILSKDDEAGGIAVTVLVLLSMGGANAAWTVGNIMTSEVFPTLIRNTGAAVCSMGARIAGILAPQIVLLGNYTHWTLPYVVYATLAIASTILVIIFIPETVGQPLPETIDEISARRRVGSMGLPEIVGPLPETVGEGSVSAQNGNVIDNGTKDIEV